MPRQQQDSLLPAVRQGAEGHETATQSPYLVRIFSVHHATDIHIYDAKIAVRNPLQRRSKGGGGFNGLRVRQEVVQHIVLINIYTKPTIPLVVAHRGGQSW